MITIKVLGRTENLPPQYLERRWGRRSWTSTGSTVAWCLLAWQWWWQSPALSCWCFQSLVFCDLRIACCKLKDVVSVHHEWVSPSRHRVIVSRTWPIQVEYPISWWMFAKNYAVEKTTTAHILFGNILSLVVAVFYCIIMRAAYLETNYLFSFTKALIPWLRCTFG